LSSKAEHPEYIPPHAIICPLQSMPEWRNW
jgi:hypothetical protein